MNPFLIVFLSKFILMFGDLLLLLVLVDLDILFFFIDDYSRYNWIFPMKSRSEILPIYSNFAKMVETQFSKCIKTFRSDNALEYTQYAFQTLLHSYGTVHHLTCQVPLSKMVESKEKFVIFLTLFVFGKSHFLRTNNQNTFFFLKQSKFFP